MTWAVYRTTIKKVKGHFFLNLDGLPQKLVLTDGKGSERAVLENQIKAGYFYVFDRGYDDYTLFAAFRTLHAHFLTRLKSSANFEVLENHPVPPEQARVGVSSDQTVRLGGPQSELKLRLIGYQESTGKTYYYLTNRFDLDALSLVELYLYRWQIELFFGWIKRHLQFGHWYSQNPNGVLIQLYAGLITFLLLKLYAVHSSKPQWVALRIDFVRWIQRRLFNRVSQAEIEAYAQKIRSEAKLVKT
jgi:IS4 transposase